MTDPDDPTPREQALAREVDRLARKQADTDATLSALTKTVKLLVEGGPGGPPMQSWLNPVDPGNPAQLIGPDDAAYVLDDLAWWLARVYLRFDGATLSSCWAWHPDVVEELLWLRSLHRDVYEGRMASWSKVGDWHDRYRPGVVKRIKPVMDRCNLRLHTSGKTRANRAIPTVPLADHLHAVSDAWAGRREVPEPLATVLGDADRHDGAAADPRP